MITLPDASSTLGGVSAYSGPLFEWLLVVGLLLIGVVIGGMVAAALIGRIVVAVGKITGNRGRKGRRRR